MNDFEVYGSAVLIGALAGMRSMSAPAVIGQLSRNGVLDEVTGTLALARNGRFVGASGLFALGELIADKLPLTPNRTAVGPLLGRALSGGICGAVVCSSKKRPAWAGALLGAAAAVGMAYGAFKLRKEIVRDLNLPDAVIAVGEDAIVASVGVALASSLSKV